MNSSTLINRSAYAAGDVEMPEPTIEFMSGHREPVGIYDADDIKDYGDRRAAAAVLSERNRCADVAVDAIAFNGGTIQMEAHIRDAILRGTL